MSRILLVGLPRSGTTWLARVIAGTPGVRYVHEPDNKTVEPFAHVAHLGLGSVPNLRAGERPPLDYELLWESAFAGGEPSTRVARATFHRLRAAGSSTVVPRRARLALFRTAARIAARSTPVEPHVLVKSVRAYLSTEWLAERFEPVMVIVWRHPLNLVPSWIEQGWTGNEFLEGATAVSERFRGTDVWPPPTGGDAESTAWVTCALTTLLLEAAERHPDWLVLSHEATTQAPAERISAAIERLGLSRSAELEARLAEFDRPGAGWDTHRETRGETDRWRERLNATDATAVNDLLERFAAQSPVAARAWKEAPVSKP